MKILVQLSLGQDCNWVDNGWQIPINSVKGNLNSMPSSLHWARFLANFVASTTMELNYPAAIYLGALIISSVHTLLIVIIYDSQLRSTLSWFDPTNLFHPQRPLMLFTAIQVPVLVLFFSQFWMAFVQYEKMEIIKYNFAQKWTIKILGNIGFITREVLMLPILRTCITHTLMIESSQFHEQNPELVPLAWINLSALVLITGITTFLIFDQAPFSGNIYSGPSYGTLLRIFPPIRLIFGALYAADRFYSHVFPITVLIPILFITYKQPVLQFTFDTPTRIILYSSTWPFILRLINVLIGGYVPWPFALLGMPINTIAMMYLADIRIRSILENQKVSVKQIKVITQSLDHLQTHLFLPYMYLLMHKGRCRMPSCTCQTITKMKFFDKNISQYYLTIADTVRYFFDRDMPYSSTSNLKSPDKLKVISKVLELSPLFNDIIAVQGDKWNLALHQLQRMGRIIDQADLPAISFRAYSLKFRSQFERTICIRSKQEDAINSYAKTFGDFYIQVQSFHQKLQFAKSHHTDIWKELAFNDPHTQKISRLIRQVYRNHRKLEKVYKDIVTTMPAAEKVIFRFYFEYHKAICNEEPEEKTFEKDSTVYFSEDMRKYSFNSKTGVVIVSIRQGKTFGDISLTNSYMRDQIGLTQPPPDKEQGKYIGKPKQKAPININMLIPSDLQASHDIKIKNFIYSNPIRFSNQIGFFLTVNGYLREISTLIQIIPSLKDGFHSIVFVTFKPKRNVILSDEVGLVKYYSKEFYENIYEKYQEDDQILENLNVETIQALKEDQDRDFVIKNDKQKIKLIKIFGDSNNPRFLCEIYDPNAKKEETEVNLDATETFYMNHGETQLPTGLLGSIQSQQKPKGPNLIRNTDIISSFAVNLSPNRLQRLDVSMMNRQSYIRQNKKQKQAFFLDDSLAAIRNLQHGIRLKIWNVMVVTLLIGILGNIVIIIFQSYFKEQMIIESLHQRERFYVLLPTIDAGLYMLRRTNIAAFIEKDQSLFQHYQRQFTRLNQESGEILQEVSILNYENTYSYEISKNGSIVRRQGDYFMILHQELVVGITYLSSVGFQDFNFDVLLSGITIPLSNVQHNFYSAVLNGIHSILGKTEGFIDMLTEEENFEIGKFPQKQIIIYFMLGGWTLILIVVIFLCSFHITVKNILTSSHELLQSFTVTEIAYRAKQVKQYSLWEVYLPPALPNQEWNENQEEQEDGPKQNNNHSSDIFENLNRQQIGTTRKNVVCSLIGLTKIKKHYKVSGLQKNAIQRHRRISNQARKRKVSDDLYSNPKPPLSKFKKLLSTSIVRDIVSRNPPKLTSYPVCRLIFRYFLIVLPIILYYIGFLSYQAIFDHNILFRLNGTRLLLEKFHMISEIKLYTLEIGLTERLFVQEQPDFSYRAVGTKLQSLIDRLYIIERQINTDFSYSESMSEIINSVNNQNVCEMLDRFEEGGTFQFEFTREECSNISGFNYLTYGMRTGLMSFLDRSRHIYMNYRDCQKCGDPNSTQTFLALPDHKILSTLSFYFEKIIFYQESQLSTEIQSYLQVYFEVSLKIGIAAMLIIIATFLYLWKVQRRQVISELVEIQAVFSVISEKNILESEPLSKYIVENVHYDYLK